ncbi:hypothetical protein F5Y03DRAFT_400058 [Xylaria venustula]|nr:hypothetical protein F5Y03DRAFT_400058 [Xylaria venustula]
MASGKRKTSVRKPRAEGDRREPVGSQLEEARHISDFGIRDATGVHVGTTYYSAPVTVNHNHITVGLRPNRAELLFAASVALAGPFSDLSSEHTGPDLADIAWILAASLPRHPDHLSKFPTNSGPGRRPRHTHGDMASSDTGHTTSIESLSEHQETPGNQHKRQVQENAKTVAERGQRHQPQAQLRTGDSMGNGPGQREAKNGWRQRLRSWLRRKKKKE